MKLSLVNLVPLKEESAQAKALAKQYTTKQLQQMLDQRLGPDQEAASNMSGFDPNEFSDSEDFGPSANDLDAAITIKRGGDVPYDVAVGKMTQGEYDKYMSTVAKDKAAFTKSSKFDRMNESTEKAWNAVDVSRKAEKEISNKEWNARTTKKLDMLIALNKAGKFKKDFNDERLQGWVDQNYSWEKLSKQFKLNEVYSSIYEQGNTQTVEININGTLTPITIQSMGIEGKPVTISFEYKEKGFNSEIPQSFEVDFEYDENIGGSEAYDEPNTVIYKAESSDGKWEFALPVYVDPNPNNEEIWDYDWSELEITQLKDIDKNPMGEAEEDLTFEPEDMDNPDEDLVIIGSGYLDIKSKFGERPPQTNGEYAEIGQKVVDQLHNGDKEAAMDYIMSQINEGKVCESCGQIHEGSCGYTHKTDGSKLRTPGGTKGMDANKRTMGMMREVIKKEIKRFHENK